MDMPEADDPNSNAPRHFDSAAGSYNGDAFNSYPGGNGNGASRDMVASLGDVKPTIRDFDGKRE